MIWGSESDHVDILVFDQLSHIGVAFNLLAGALTFLQLPIEDLLIRIAQRHQSRALHGVQIGNMTLAPSMEANHRVADIAVGADDTSGGGGLGADFRGAGRKKT